MQNTPEQNIIVLKKYRNCYGNPLTMPIQTAGLGNLCLAWYGNHLLLGHVSIICNAVTSWLVSRVR